MSSSERRPVDYHTEYAPPDISPTILAAVLSRIHNTPQNGAYERSSQPHGTAASRARDSTKTSHEKRVQEAIRLQGRLKLLTIANNKSHIPPANSNINILNTATIATEKTNHPHNSSESGLRAEVSKSMLNEFLVVPPPPTAGPERSQYMSTLDHTKGGGGGKSVTIAGKTIGTPVHDSVNVEPHTPSHPSGGVSDDGRTNDKHSRTKTVQPLHSTVGGTEPTQPPTTPAPTPSTAANRIPSGKPIIPPNTFTNYSGPSTMNCFGEKMAQEGVQRRDKYAMQVWKCDVM